MFYLNNTFTNYLNRIHTDCGYKAYIDKYFKFPPPKGAFPVPPDPYVTNNYTCDVIDIASEAITAVNPCFNSGDISSSRACSFDASADATVSVSSFDTSGATY